VSRPPASVNAGPSHRQGPEFQELQSWIPVALPPQTGVLTRDGGGRPPMLSLSKRTFMPVFDGRRAERKVSAPHPPCMSLLSHGSPV
jgi:hypothetical protein